MGRKDTKSIEQHHDKHSDSEDEICNEHKRHQKYCVKEVRWGILKGEEGEKGKKGSRGKRGPRGKHGHHGRNGHDGKDGCDAILSFGAATNDQEGEIISNIGDAIEWTNTYFPQLDVNVTGNVVNLKNEGVYQFDFSLRGIVANTFTSTFGMGLLYNGNILNGSKFTLTNNVIPPFTPYNYAQLLNGTVITEIDQPNANIQLVNLSNDFVTFTNLDMSNNASINVIRLI
jgi:hypothetical protein